MLDFNLTIVNMTGGLMQLVAYGAQDIYLTGDPMITHFKSVYRRHTNFAMECVEQSFNGTPNFGMSLSAIICRNGDLITGAYIETTLPDLDVDNDTIVNRWTENVGHHLIKSIDIEIGGQRIDKHYGEWLDIWAQLTVSASHKLGYYEMIGQGRPDALGRPTGLQKDINGSMTQGQTIYIPLQFWFCRNIGLALPLIALQFHEVKINIMFAEVSDLLRTGAIVGTNRLSNTKLWIDYIYLDVEERKKFIQTSHALLKLI